MVHTSVSKVEKTHACCLYDCLDLKVMFGVTSNFIPLDWPVDGAIVTSHWRRCWLHLRLKQTLLNHLIIEQPGKPDSSHLFGETPFKLPKAKVAYHSVSIRWPMWSAVPSWLVLWFLSLFEHLSYGVLFLPTAGRGSTDVSQDTVLGSRALSCQSHPFITSMGMTPFASLQCPLSLLTSSPLFNSFTERPAAPHRKKPWN